MTDEQPVVLLAGGSDSAHIIYHELDEAFGVDRVIRENRVDRLTFLKRRIDRLGWRTVAGQVAFRLVAMPLLGERAADRIETILERAGMERKPIPSDDVLEVDSVNDSATAEALRESDPDAVVIGGTRIIDEVILESVDAPFLNMHAGLTPMFRGVHGGYWALAEDEPETCGVTVHLVDPGIDTGDIVAQETIAPTEADNFASYPYLQFEAGLPLLREAVGDAIEGRLRTFERPDAESQLWSHPTLCGYLSRRLVDGVR